MNKKLINWIKVTKNVVLPPASPKAAKETFIQGASDKLLLFCKDGQMRFGRYVHGFANSFLIEGVTGAPKDWVTHFAYTNLPVD